MLVSLSHQPLIGRYSQQHGRGHPLSVSSQASVSSAASQVVSPVHHIFLLQLPPLCTTARQGLHALQGWWKLLVWLYISMMEWFTGSPQRHIWKAGEELLVFVTIYVTGRLLCKINHTGGEKESNGLLNLPLYIKNIEHKREQLEYSSPRLQA